MLVFFQEMHGPLRGLVPMMGGSPSKYRLSAFWLLR